MLGNLSVLLNEGDGTFAPEVLYGVGGDPVAVASSDLDNDGDEDVVVANITGEAVSVLLNQCGDASPCPADLDGDGELTVFDFLEFQNLFDTGDLRADFDDDGELTLFDCLAFQNAFDAGCP